MGSRLDIVTLLLLAANLIFSIMAFNDHKLKERFLFHVGKILHGKEYFRMITSGFLHLDYNHLIMNMLGLFFVGPSIAFYFGPFGYLLIYFGAMIGGDLLALLVYRNDSQYTALGASGAIYGIIFALVYFAPNTLFLLFFLIPCPAWLLAIGYLAYSIYGIRTRMGNVGHEAHLGGGILGMLVAILLVPQLIITNWWIVALVFIPTSILIYLIVKRPDLLLRRRSRGVRTPSMPKQNPFQKRRGPRLVRDEPERKYQSKREELDALLDKVAQKGYNGLSRKEKMRLDELSNGGGSSDGSGRPGGN